MITSIYEFEKELRRKEHSTANRLRSIHHDAKFVMNIKREFAQFPLLANLRCGAWYCPPTLRDGECYFKSTDGHQRHWQFNLNRLNLHVISLALRSGGCIIVDSTRKGKKYPDSFTRTIPIWACVMNRVLFTLKNSTSLNSSESEERWMKLRMPKEWVPPTEVAQVEVKVKEFVQLVLEAESLRPKLLELSASLMKPMKPYYVSPDHRGFSPQALETEMNNYTPLILVSASMLQNQKFSWYYVQGAADDHESWCMGITPEMFWKHVDKILSWDDDEEIEATVKEVVEMERQASLAPITSAAHSKEEILSHITAIGSTNIHLSTSPEGEVTTLPGQPNKLLLLQVGEGKKLRHRIRPLLDKILPFVRDAVAAHQPILIHCTNDSGLVTTLGLSVLVKYFTTSLDYLGETPPTLTKQSIRSSYLSMSQYWTKNAPPRYLLVDVNRYFLSGNYPSSHHVDDE